MRMKLFRYSLACWLCCDLAVDAQTPDDPVAALQTASGDAELSAGNYLKAKAIFTQAAVRLGAIAGTSDSQFHEIYRRSVEADVLTGNYAVARDAAQRMLDKISKKPEEQAQVYLLQARIAVERGEFDAAAGLFERARNGASALAGDVRAGYGELLRRQEKYQDAARTFAEATSSCPRRAPAGS